MSTFFRRPTAGLITAALTLSGSLAAYAPASARADDCVTDQTLHLVGINDLHGEIEKATALFTPLEKLRQGNEHRVLFLSAGDDIGGSSFVSAASEDIPTLDVLKAMELDVASAGNHEFDRGWSDLRDRVIPHISAMPNAYDMLGANVFVKGGTEVAKPLKEYKLFDLGGVRVAVVGAVTDDLPSLVSPGGLKDIVVTDPVEAVNRVAAKLKDGDASNGEAHLVVASIHEGGPGGMADGAAAAAANPKFANMFNNMSKDVDVIFNGHTHQDYTYVTPKGQPIVQTRAKASGLARVDVEVSDTFDVCKMTSSLMRPAKKDEVDLSLPRIAAVDKIVADAKAKAKKIGSEVIADASVAVSTAGNGGNGVRDQESPLSNMVAEMFYDTLSDGNPEFIGIQNPGGTRASFDKGDVTYEEAANILPFANSLFTTQITGAQFRKVLEQQWQRDTKGNVPSRPYLALGLSKNVSYDYNEANPEGSRIGDIWINGKPIDDKKLYTVGSGSFLIEGGDNFHELAKGVNRKDSGQVDLHAWVSWLKAKKTIAPDYSKRGVSMTLDPTELAPQLTVTLGAPGTVYKGTLDMLLDASGERVSPQLFNKTIEVYVDDALVGDDVAKTSIKDGVGTVVIQISKLAKGDHTLKFVAKESGTVIRLPVSSPGPDWFNQDKPTKPTKPTKPGKPRLPKTGC